MAWGDVVVMPWAVSLTMALCKPHHLIPGPAKSRVPEPTFPLPSTVLLISRIPVTFTT